MNNFTISVPIKSILPFCYIVFVFGTKIETANAQVFENGDIFVALENGTVSWRSSTGALKQTLNTMISGPATGMAFDASGALYVTNFSAGDVSRFNTEGVLQGTFGSGHDSPESIVFDKIGNGYVSNIAENDPELGHGKGIQKYNSDGTFIKTIYGERTDWIDLAEDQCTFLYTTEADFIGRYNACTNTTSEFASNLGGKAYALRIRQNGEVLLANGTNILRLSSTGIIMRKYDVVGADHWFSLTLDPDGTSFWAGDESSFQVFRIDIATGNVLTSFTEDETVYGIAAFWQCAVTPDVRLDSVRTDSCGTGRICTKYRLPYRVINEDTTFGKIEIDLDVYQNNTKVTTLTSPLISTYSADSIFCFDINPSTLGIDINLGGFDYTITGRFTLSELACTPKIIGSPARGMKSGVNNDYSSISCVKLELYHVLADNCGSGAICTKYSLPYNIINGDTTFGEMSIGLDVYQNNTKVTTLTSPAISTYSTDSSYCFTINPSTLGIDPSLGGFDYTITGRFDVSGYPSLVKMIGDIGAGIKIGVNNDFLSIGSINLGDVILDMPKVDSCFTGRICTKYFLPHKSINCDTVFGQITIDLDIYQNNEKLRTLTSSPISRYSSDSSYCFPIDPYSIGINTGLVGFDYTITGRFTLSGFSPLPKMIGKPGTGIKEVVNNDYLSNCQFYSKQSGDLHLKSTWGSNPDGSGAQPVDFGFGKTFNLVNRGYIFFDMTADWSVEGAINIYTGLNIRGFSLSVADLMGPGVIQDNGNLTITGSHGGNVDINSAGLSLNNFTLNRTGNLASASLRSAGASISNVLSIKNGTLNTNGRLSLGSSATNTARVAPIPSTGDIIGDVTVFRYIPPGRKAWRLLSAPVGGSQTINAAWQEGLTTSAPDPIRSRFGIQITGGARAKGFDQNPTSTSSIKTLNSANDKWVAVPNTNATAVNSNAFLVFIAGNRTMNPSNATKPATDAILRATGPLKKGDQTFPVSPARPTVRGVEKGYVAIPNPYACPINFATITRNNVQNNFYVWDPKIGKYGGYVNISYNGSSYDVEPKAKSPESQYIQSGQGFLVHSTFMGSTGVAGSIVIKESDKSVATPANNVFRSANNSYGLRITLLTAKSDTSALLLDEVLESYSPAFSNEVDDLDVLKLSNINENLAMVRANNNLMVERRSPMTDDDTISLELSNTEETSYRFQFHPDKLSSSVLSASLEDKYLNTFTPLSLSDTTLFDFEINADDASKSPSRFRVILVSKNARSAITNVEKGSIRAFPNPISNRTINLEMENLPKGRYNVQLVNSLGIVVFRGFIICEGGSVTKTIQLLGNLPKGIYQLNVSKLNSKNTIKVFLQ
jgi:hypothetical protein